MQSVDAEWSLAGWVALARSAAHCRCRSVKAGPVDTLSQLSHSSHRRQRTQRAREYCYCGDSVTLRCSRRGESAPQAMLAETMSARLVWSYSRTLPAVLYVKFRATKFEEILTMYWWYFRGRYESTSVHMRGKFALEKVTEWSCNCSLIGSYELTNFLLLELYRTAVVTAFVIYSYCKNCCDI